MAATTMVHVRIDNQVKSTSYKSISRHGAFAVGRCARVFDARHRRKANALHPQSPHRRNPRCLARDRRNDKCTQRPF